jgi:RNA polymerase sigma factor for flagellar operon FliA
VWDEGGEVSLGGPDPEISLEQTGVKEALVEAIRGAARARETRFVTRCYGELTPREIGDVLGVTESRVSQLHTTAILRHTVHLSGAAAREPAET